MPAIIEQLTARIRVKFVSEISNSYYRVTERMEACGICHGDSVTKLGLFPDIKYPRVPGHEIAGVIDEVGTDVTDDAGVMK
jgi:alcohol dehydrogenase, propanol-preferring